jgi:tryptophan-rich sensory protein
MRWIALIFWLGVCFLVAGLGARFTTPEIKGWYRTLVRPSFAPPNWVFGPVWTLLYALMAVAAWMVWTTPESQLRSWALALFVAQLCLNLAWSWIFFRAHALGAALGEVLLLWGFIGLTTVVFGTITPWAAWLMAPYWAWVTFASALNAGFYRLNQS